jgi:tRNA(Ile)-lysidine synthase
MRARIRMKLLPLLEKQFQPAIVEHLATLAELAREDEEYLDAVVEERATALVRKCGEGVRIAIGDLLDPFRKPEFSIENTESAEKKKAARALRKRLVRWVVESLKPRAGQLGAGHVETVLELVRSGENGSSIALPGGVEVRKERDALVFLATGKAVPEAAPNERREFEYNIDLACGSQDVGVPELGCVVRLRVIDWPCKRGETSIDRTVLDRERLRLPVVLRNWRPGDRMRPLGHRNAQKLKRLLNEKHVSRWERNGWPVLTSGGVLAWARGFHVAAEFAADERTRAGIVIAEEQL